MISLETSRLRLRGWQERDAAPLAAMNADPKVMRFFPAPLTRQESDDQLARMRAEWVAEGFGMWAVELKEESHLAGFVGLHRVSMEGPLHGAIEIAWRLSSNLWGRGYAPEAAVAALEFARQAGMSEVVAFTAQQNLPSQRVMQKIGMEYRGLFDHPALAAGHLLRTHVLYGITL